MIIEELLGKRCLIKETARFGNSGVNEVKVLEIAPSRNWVKLMNSYGNKYWKPTSEIQVIEVLIDLKTGKPLN
tara:strand:- start:313 stop:531 length:219 start_codon:yes stop_codon:yes gene_type:complete